MIAIIYELYWITYDQAVRCGRPVYVIRFILDAVDLLYI